MDGCVAQYVVVNLRFLMFGLIIPESMCNPSCYAVLQDAKKGDNIPPALQKLCGSYFCEDGDHTARSQCTSAQPVVNMEFISVLIQTFFLLIPNGDFILPLPARRKVGRLRCE